MSWKRLVVDIEANNLLMPLIDYSTMPFKFKEEARLWCISVRDIDTNQSVLLMSEEHLKIVAPVITKEYYIVGEVTDSFGNKSKSKIVEKIEYLDSNGIVKETTLEKTFDPLKEYILNEYPCDDGIKYNALPKRVLTREMFKKVLSNCEVVVGHNLVGYDLPALKLFDMLEYRIEYPGKGSHKLFDNSVKILDTLLMSKLYSPDRVDSFGKHGLAAFGQRTGNAKLDFHDFDKYTWRMGFYCDQDTSVGKDTLLYLEQEEDLEKDYAAAYSMEIKLIDLTIRQEAFGFDFDSELASKAITDLEEKLRVREEEVEPQLPPKSLNKGQKDYYTPPKIQFKKNGDPSAAIYKFANKVNNVPVPLDPEDKSYGTASDFIVTKPRKDDESAEDYYLICDGIEYPLPCLDPVKSSLPTSINDNNDVKGYLISLGWEPLEWVERDITKNSKKQKNPEDKVIASIKKYAEETQTSPFRKHRYEYLKLSMEKDIGEYLLAQFKKKPRNALKVITTPPYRTGAEKNLCQNLEKLAKKLGASSFIKSIVQWHTFSHRKNCIAGGTIDEDGEPTKGYLSFVREDGRIATPADTVGAATYRYLHKCVANVPRGGSLYGEIMRAFFGAGEGLVQLGFDFSSLEARVEGHYILPFEGGAELAEALLASKPNDVHTLTGKKLGIDRSDAKAITYAIMYGAAAAKLKKMLGLTDEEAEKMWSDFWDSVGPLKELRDKLTEFWEVTDKSYIPGIDGRKIRVRSQHSLINALFQSAGAILAKWSVVRVAEKLEELNLLGDPFLHTKEDVKVWQMIIYHDEAQYALHRSLIKVKSFSDPELHAEFAPKYQAWIDGNKEDKEPEHPLVAVAEKWMEENPIDGLYSAVGHTPEGVHYVTLPNTVSETILEAIDRTVEEFNIRVPLGIEWITGKNWFNCH